MESTSELPRDKRFDPLFSAFSYQSTAFNHRTYQPANNHIFINNNNLLNTVFFCHATQLASQCLGKEPNCWGNSAVTSANCSLTYKT